MTLVAIASDRGSAELIRVSGNYSEPVFISGTELNLLWAIHASENSPEERVTSHFSQRPVSLGPGRGTGWGGYHGDEGMAVKDRNPTVRILRISYALVGVVFTLAWAAMA
ncbi:hypothetical protein llg_13410 [Luteolibacter sp. LG18]|nr:hypothetical protein llg_13410 [Luteolibacter sp. LG18]